MNCQTSFRPVYKFLGTLLMLLPLISSLSQTYSFTSAGASGINGPSQAQVTAAYNASTLAGQVTVVGTGIQRWVVPSTGIYAITAAGASGGYTPGAAGGKGRLITVNYSLTAGTVLDILVGQEGGRASFNTPGYAGGGGGGSFVVNGSNNSPILISGGGGGAAQGGGSFVSVQPGVDASAYNVTSGANGTGFSSSWAQVGIGGVNGGGGTNPGGYGGSGGGGFLGAGVQQYYGGFPGSVYSSSGMSGGDNRDWYGGFATTIPGGFGGGAGAGVHSNYEANAGGGGGYSGGGGGNTRVGAGGGGGNLLGAGTTYVSSGLNTGNGYVTITNLLTPAGALNFVKSTPTSGNYITVPHSASLNLGASFTIEAWVKYTG
ncbi:MAG: hypothetical protein EPO58_05190, partial [Chitinophagaceae bacterium]